MVIGEVSHGGSMDMKTFVHELGLSRWSRWGKLEWVNQENQRHREINSHEWWRLWEWWEGVGGSPSR